MILTKCDICKCKNQCKTPTYAESRGCLNFKEYYVGKIVLITGNKSIHNYYKNKYGIITKKYNEDKWIIEIEPSNLEKGGLYHTIMSDDFEVVGETYCRD